MKTLITLTLTALLTACYTPYPYGYAPIAPLAAQAQIPQQAVTTCRNPQYQTFWVYNQYGYFVPTTQMACPPGAY